MRRAAVSIMANIAEGFSRQSSKEICAVSIYCQIISRRGSNPINSINSTKLTN